MRKPVLISLLCFVLTLPVQAQDNITFAFTSNFQSQLEPIIEDGYEYGGAARMSSAIRNLRLTSDRFILLDTGNHFAGRFYREYRGIPEVELMNEFRYDAMMVGATELSMGEDFFDNWAKFARFPLILSDLIAPPQCKVCRHIISYTSIERVGLTVGIFALQSPELEEYGRLPDRIGVDQDYIAVAREMVSILNEKCDIIVLLSQLDIERNVKLADEVCEIDLIVVNSWAGYADQPMVIENETGCITIIGYAGNRGRKLGVIKTTWDELGNLEDFLWQPITLSDSIPLDPKVHEMVQAYAEKEDAVSIGVTKVELDGREAVVNTAESNLGNLIADAAMSAFPGADIALIPGGSIYGNRIIEPGNITDVMIREILPYGEHAVLMEVEGEILEKIMERSVCNIENAFGGFMQLAGASIEVDTSRDAQCINIAVEEVEKEGHRIRSFRINGEKFDDDDTYSIVTTDFVSNGGFGYYWLAEKSHISGRKLSEIIIDYISKNSPVSSQYEGRIVIEP